MEYLAAETSHVFAKDRWTKPRDPDNDICWLNSPLASVVISATPEDSRAPFATCKKTSITSLEVRAAYRLCGALYTVGEGARKDALDSIDDARGTCF